MVTRRTAKSKGSQFEYDCQATLQQLFPDTYRTAERGFQHQYDLRSDDKKIVCECKRLKGVSWNQAVRFYEKLTKKAPAGYVPYLFFQSNRQPPLIMYKSELKQVHIMLMSEFFGITFIKHESTRNRN